MRGKLLWITGAAVVLVLSVASVAFAATQDRSTTAPAPQARAAAGTLLDDPAAAADLQALRTENQTDMQAWFDKYGADTTTSAAQAALTELRTEHQSDMEALFAKYGVDAGLCSGGGSGGGMMGGGYGRGMGDNGCGLLQSN